MGTQTEIEIMPLEFCGRGSQKGFKFKQIARNGNVALYQKTDSETERSWWEVIRIGERKHKVVNIGGIDVEFNPKEVYPSDEGFGGSGWCFNDYPTAEVKYNSEVILQFERKSKVSDDVAAESIEDI